MGIPSLTKYLEDRSAQYFEKYELYNCSLVIDGHSICNNLYNWEYGYWKTGYSPYCYGGDYDRYAEIVKQFFLLLSNCNITPYIIFDGCCENNKASQVKQRLNEKVKINSEITPNSIHQTYAIGAVALRYAFRDVLVELGIKSHTCTSDANKIMASLAKHLKCPVLSTDSDFFISSAMFISFSSIHCKNEENENLAYKFISCKIYKNKNLINALNNRPDMHYLLPVLLGNNQFSTDIFESFFRKFRIIGSRQKKVDLVFQWLKKQNTLETAIVEILKCLSTQQKSGIWKIIKHTIMGFTPVSITPLLEHFDIGNREDSSEPSMCFKKMEETVGLKIQEDNTNNDVEVSELFETKFTECQYPPFFMDMLMGNRYFVWPNIEDCSKPDANSIGYTIMSAIHNILVKTDEKQLTVLRRNTLKLEEFVLPAYKDPLPSIEEIEYLNMERKRDLVFKILEIDQEFLNIFEHFPKEWHLFLLSLKYASSKSKLTISFIYSVIFCFLTLGYIDPKLKGFYRSMEELQNLNTIPQTFNKTLEESRFSTISQEESITFMHKIIKYFQVDPADNAETYDRNIMHSIAELQCTFIHLKFLNTLLNFPFENAFIYKIFNGTFIYNMNKKLESEASLENYIAKFLQECTSIYCVFISVDELLKKYSVSSSL